MLRRLPIVAVLAIWGISSALAQQQPDPEFLKRALMAMQEQRNQALDSAALAAARAAILADKLKELEAKAAAPAPSPDHPKD